MTENEAKEKIKYRISTATDIAGSGIDGRAYEDMEMALKALEEVEQYRKIGTVEECREAKDFLDFLADTMPPNDYEAYLQIYNSIDEKGE